MMESIAIEGYRLSPQQRRLWSLRQVDPTQPEWVYGVFLLEGAVKLSALEAALNELLQRHEILRTTFQCLPGMTVPLQVVETDCESLELKVLPHSATSPAQALDALLPRLEQAANSKSAPLPQKGLQAAITPLTPNQHLLVLTLPALCADDSTWQILGCDLSQLYSATVGAIALEDAQGAEDPMQYVDLAEWQNELLTAEEASAGQAFWQKIRDGAMPVTLPFERRSAEELAQMQRLGFPLSPECLSSLTALAEAQDVSLSTVLLTTWAIVLGRLADVADLTLGLMVDGRHYAELEQAAGPLVRVLPLRLSLGRDVLFCQAMQQTQQSVQEARQWQDYVWHKSTSDLPPALGFEFATRRPVTAAGMTISLYQHAPNLEPFQLKLSCVRNRVQSGEDVLTAELLYDAQRFSAAAVAQIASYFETGLTAALAAPTTAIQRLSLWTEGDRQRFLSSVQPDTERDASTASQDSLLVYPWTAIHQWFEAQVARSPAQTAAVFETEQLTYTQLNAQANQLAHYLRQIGVEAEDRIVLYGDRGLPMLVGILGVLKAGAAYVPIDPSVPFLRIPDRLKEVQASAVLTQHEFGTALPPLPVPVVHLDGAEQAAIAQQLTENLSHSIQSENLAYVLFTSGSTGQPKGVAVEHRQVVNYVRGILPQLDLREGHHCAMVSTLAADLGNTMLFPCLCMGGCLHLMAPERILDPAAWAEYAQQQPIDSLKIVPSHLKGLLGSPDAAAILPRHSLILGGETVHWDLVEQVRQLSPCRVLNHYGPTETTVGVLTHPVASASESDAATVPLGRPLSNVQVYLLDEHLQSVPAGIPGEVYIGGVSVSRGYINRPQRTAIAFLPDPFSSEPGTRMYRTGDRGRYCLDGTIEFLGRRDHQVKLRGFRI
ncbi:MAG: amino acid adenylation domain-containing protein, partial [Cyanobacteria bacterium J06626_23]